MTTILLVDDDPLQAYLLMSLLGRKHAHVRRTKDGAEALCLIEQPEFIRHLGLVISGHHTQAIGGQDFVAEVRSRVPGVPVLVLGTRSESASDYADQDVAYLPRQQMADRILDVANELMGRPKAEVA